MRRGEASISAGGCFAPTTVSAFTIAIHRIRAITRIAPTMVTSKWCGKKSDTELLPLRLDMRQHAIHGLDIIRLHAEQAAGHLRAILGQQLDQVGCSGDGGHRMT
jgi:hypothetical protein